MEFNQFTPEMESQFEKIFNEQKEKKFDQVVNNGELLEELKEKENG